MELILDLISQFPTTGDTFTGAGKTLKDAIHQVVLAAAVEDSRPVLTGVNIEIEGSQITFAAADGFRLAVRTAELLEPVNEKLSIIVPSRTLSEIERLIEGDEPVDFVITTQRSQALFRLKNVEVVWPCSGFSS